MFSKLYFTITRRGWPAPLTIRKVLVNFHYAISQRNLLFCFSLIAKNILPFAEFQMIEITEGLQNDLSSNSFIYLENFCIAISAPLSFPKLFVSFNVVCSKEPKLVTLYSLSLYALPFNQLLKSLSLTCNRQKKSKALGKGTCSKLGENPYSRYQLTQRPANSLPLCNSWLNPLINFPITYWFYAQSSFLVICLICQSQNPSSKKHHICHPPSIYNSSATNLGLKERSSMGKFNYCMPEHL